MKERKIFPAFIIFLFLLVIIFVLLKYYSDRVSIKQDGFYEVSCIVKGDYDQADEIKNKIKDRIGFLPSIEKTAKNQYEITFGKYKSSYEAGESAFSLFADSIIQNYSVQLDGKEKYDYFSNVPYVSNYEGRASLFSLDLKKKTSSLLWNDWGEEVVALEVSPGKDVFFFLTVSGYGKKSGVSYIYDSRLYLCIRNENIFRMVGYYKNGIQFYSYWNAKNEYMTSFTSLDSSTNSNVIQDIMVYDTSGVKIQGMKKVFNLIQDGYPSVPKKKLEYTSDKNIYSFFNRRNEQKENCFYIKKNYSNDEYLINKAHGEVQDLAWSPDQNYLFFIYSDSVKLSAKNTRIGHFIVAYDLLTNKIIRTFTSDDYKYLSVFGRLLAIDAGSGIDSKVIFYDYPKDEIYLKLQVNDGCAIKSLPIAK